jgi:iron(II)-dependent oxidoreductase
LRRLLKFWPSVKAEAAPPPQAQRGDTWTNPKDHAKMVFIPAGEFVMGTTPAQVEELLRGFPDWKREGFANEQPAHVVYLDAYWIDKTEVTNAQFARFVRETGYKAEGGWQEEDGKEQHPAVKVSWNDAVAYAQWAGKRLPTEAEWEKAARGEEGRVWPWGNVWEETRCNFRGRADGYGGTAPVGSFPQGASPYGCLNMAGNVWEWCADWYEADYYGNSPERNPAGPPSGEKRVLRGGSWIISYPNFVRCAYRYSFDPRLGHGSYGFRCAKTPR